MERGVICSAVLHLAVIALIYFGLPEFAHTLPPLDTPVPVDIVTVADITNAPPPKPEPVKKEPPKPQPPKPPEAKAPAPPPPPPEPEVKAPPEPAPEPKPEPPKAVAEAAPPPLPKPKAKPQPPVEAKPKQKPPPPDEMASVLRSVEKLKQQQPKEETPLEAAEALKERNRTPRTFNPSAPITISQIDAIRRHFEKCWNLPAGARDAGDLAVEIRVTLSPDATVQSAEYVDPSKLNSSPFYRAAAESAMRAVRNPLCRSLKDVGLQPDQYDQWKDMVITFNPKQMIGA